MLVILFTYPVTDLKNIDSIRKNVENALFKVEYLEESFEDIMENIEKTLTRRLKELKEIKN